MRKADNKIVYEYVLAQLKLAEDYTRRGKKGVINKIEHLGAELVRRGLLTEEQEESLRYE